MQHPVARSRSIDNYSGANTRYFSQAKASRTFSVPPHRTLQHVGAAAHKPVPVHSWSHIAPAGQKRNEPRAAPLLQEPFVSTTIEISKEAMMEEVPVLPCWSPAATNRTNATGKRCSGRSLTPWGSSTSLGSGVLEDKNAEAALLRGQSVPPTLAAAQEATSEVVRRMMDRMGGFEACGQANPQLSAWMEAASAGAWTPPTAPPTNSNARRRRFMDPQQGQSQQQAWLRH